MAQARCKTADVLENLKIADSCSDLQTNIIDALLSAAISSIQVTMKDSSCITVELTGARTTGANTRKHSRRPV